MKQSNGKKQNNHSQQKLGAFHSLLDKPTRENSSGFAFSFAAMFIFGLSLVVSLILGWSGFNPQTDGTPDWYLYLSYALTPVALLLAAAWYFFRTKKSVVQALKSQKCGWKYYLLAIVLQIGLFSLATLNTFLADGLEKLGYTQAEVDIPSLDGFGLLGVILVVAVLPAIFEEIIFRGIVLNGAYAYGTAGAALLCGGLFAIFHQNPVQTIYQFLWGTAFALMAIRAGSIFPTMLAHFVNNAVIILLQKFGVGDIPLPIFIPVMVLSGLCLLGSLWYLICMDKNILPQEEGDTLEQKKTKRSVFVLGTAIGILICFVGWATQLYNGFAGA